MRRGAALWIKGVVLVSNRLARSSWLGTVSIALLVALVALPPRGTATVPLTGIAGRRGVYALGPVVLAMGDPFGLFEAHLQVAAGARRVVYPRPQEVSLNLDPPGIVPATVSCPSGVISAAGRSSVLRVTRLPLIWTS